MGKKKVIDERIRLRELACQTLEAYRSINSAAAAASFTHPDSGNGEGLTRAGELLEAVVTEIKGGSKAGES